MRSLYNLGINLYSLAIRLAAPFNPKAKKWIEGRRGWQLELRKKVYVNDRWLWFHCSSLGEFEQGRPLFEALREEFPYHKFLLTFFSPSGYEIRKDFSLADYVAYLPADNPANVAAFLDIIRPQAAFFIKYDLWVNYLLGLKSRNIPVFLVSALLQPESKFLKSYLSPLYRQAFQAFDRIFTQDEATFSLLEPLVGAERLQVTGDTRFDRAANLPKVFREVPGLREFVGEEFCVVCGSPWPLDEEIILKAIESLQDLPIRWVIAPHEIDPARIDRHLERFPERSVRYSALGESTGTKEILWIDNVGMLNRLYHYADLTYVGGGQDRGIHNTQEPAAYGKPVAFGPQYERFREAVDMVALGCAFVIRNAEEFENYVREFFRDRKKLAETGSMSRNYMQSQAGATEKVKAAVLARLAPAQPK